MTDHSPPPTHAPTVMIAEKAADMIRGLPALSAQEPKP